MPANRYLWITLVFACLTSWFYFGDLWRAPDSCLFTSSGDGLQGYYQTAWHARYDSTDWQQESLNYPFGESIFFTGGQPLLSNPARWLGGSDSMIGASNVFMLCSGIIATLFVFLILVRLGVSGFYACVFSLGIVMLSQQWERLGGHFALSVLWAIPLLLWLLLRYFEELKLEVRSGWWMTGSMATMLFLLGLVQLYYLFFAAALMAAFTLVYLFRSGIPKKARFLLQSVLMFAVPFILLQTLMHASSDVSDRTAIPWGFLVFRSTAWSYLYPFGMFYEHWFSFLKPSTALEWEGLAFIGASAFMALVASIFILLRNSIRIKKLERIPTMLLALLVSALLCILLSMAFPFNLGFETLLYQLGPVQQFRGIGRFAFVAYYPLTVAAFALFYRFTGQTKVAHVALIGLGLLLLIDGHARMSSVASRIAHERGTSLRGTAGDYPFLNAVNFQAIHPLPYVHVGSENIGFTAADEAMQKLYDASLALHLPSTATVMSRTSLSESFLSCGMAWELMETPAIVANFPDDRPLLVLADMNHLQESDRKLLAYADSIYGDGRFNWYALPLTAFGSVLRSNQERANEVLKTCTYGSEHVSCNDSLQRFTFSDTTYAIRFSRGWIRLFEKPLPVAWKSDTCKVSFWVKDFTRDLLPRTVLEIIQYDANHAVVDYQTEFMGKRIIGMRGGDALVEYTLSVKENAVAYSVAIENKLIQGQPIEINSMLVRPQWMNCRILRGGKETLNNRIYSN